MSLPECCTGNRVEELTRSPTTILNLTELAAHFRFTDTQKFRTTVLQAGTIPWLRHSRQRFEVRKCDLPD